MIRLDAARDINVPVLHALEQLADVLLYLELEGGELKEEVGVTLDELIVLPVSLQIDPVGSSV